MGDGWWTLFRVDGMRLPALLASVHGAAAHSQPSGKRTESAANMLLLLPFQLTESLTLDPCCCYFFALAGAVYVRRHSEHSANIVVRHNPHRCALRALVAAALHLLRRSALWQRAHVRQPHDALSHFVLFLQVTSCVPFLQL